MQPTNKLPRSEMDEGCSNFRLSTKSVGHHHVINYVSTIDPALTRIVSFHEVWSGKKLVGIVLWMVVARLVLPYPCLTFCNFSNQAKQPGLITEKNGN